jgi:hypothetical protein
LFEFRSSSSEFSRRRRTPSSSAGTDAHDQGDGFAELKADPAFTSDIVEPELEWMGINSFGDSAVMVGARIKTMPGRQWAINRAYNGILKKTFDARGIEIPFPHQTIYFGEDKQGKALPMHLVGTKATPKGRLPNPRRWPPQTAPIPSPRKTYRGPRADHMSLKSRRAIKPSFCDFRTREGGRERAPSPKQGRQSADIWPSAMASARIRALTGRPRTTPTSMR